MILDGAVSHAVISPETPDKNWGRTVTKHLPSLLIAVIFLAATALQPLKANDETDEPVAENETEAAQTGPADAEAVPVDVTPNDYRDPANWLCHPSKNDDACDTDLSTTIVAADGSTTVEDFAAAADPAFDCFYVYPTVSVDETPNSDMTANDEELSVIEQQFT